MSQKSEIVSARAPEGSFPHGAQCRRRRRHHTFAATLLELDLSGAVTATVVATTDDAAFALALCREQLNRTLEELLATWRVKFSHAAASQVTSPASQAPTPVPSI